MNTEDTTPKPVELPSEVTLHGTAGPLKIRLVVPQSLGLRYEVTYALAKSEPKAVCAALGLCSSALRKHARWDHDVMAFGAASLDWLLGQGVPYLDILNAGRIAWRHVSKDLIPASEVKEAEDFSEPKTDKPTG